MGEIADMTIEGDLCCQCGVILSKKRAKLAGAEFIRQDPDGVPVWSTPGYPVPCGECHPRWTPGDDPFGDQP